MCNHHSVVYLNLYKKSIKAVKLSSLKPGNMKTKLPLASLNSGKVLPSVGMKSKILVNLRISTSCVKYLPPPEHRMTLAPRDEGLEYLNSASPRRDSCHDLMVRFDASIMILK